MRHAWLIASLVLLAPAAAQAETPEVERFEPAREVELLGLQGIDLDTGWQPPGSNIQVQFLTHADDNIVVEMPGDAVLDWDTGELHFVGDEDAGVLDVDVGVFLDARFRFDLLGQQFESSIIGPYDLGIFREGNFTPYLLPGNDHRPFQIDDETIPIEVFNYAIVDALIASGNFFVDAGFDIDMELSCEQIVVSDADGVDMGAVVMEFEALAAADPDAALVELFGTLHCTLLSDIELILYPGVELQIGFEEFQLVPFELRVPLMDDRTDPLVFERVPLVFDMPPAPEPEGSTGDASSGGDDSGTSQGGSAEGSDTGDRPPEDTTSGDASSSSSGDTDGQGQVSDGEGCACSSGSGRGGAWWLLLVLALRPRRRR
jgi:MYXO-CTERM domain-containing protein